MSSKHKSRFSLVFPERYTDGRGNDIWYALPLKDHAHWSLLRRCRHQEQRWRSRLRPQSASCAEDSNP